MSDTIMICLYTIYCLLLFHVCDDNAIKLQPLRLWNDIGLNILCLHIRVMDQDLRFPSRGTQIQNSSHV
jgi:hypothetical protein